MAIVGGSLSDRVDRKTVMILCDIARFLIMTILCLAYATNHLNINFLYLSIFLMSIAGSVFVGCQTPSIPFLVGEKNTQSAVSIMQTTEQTVNLVAPPLGGIILGLIGPLPALILDACTYLGSQVSLASVKTFGPDKQTGFPSLKEIGHDLAMGWEFIKTDAALHVVTFSSLILSSAYFLVVVNIVPLLKREYHISDQYVGFAYGIMAIGAVVGAFLAGHTKKPYGKTTMLLNYVDSIPWIIAVLSHNFIIAIICIAISNMANSYKFVTGIAWRVRIIPVEKFGRVFGSMRFISVPGMFFGGLIGGVLGDHFGTQKAITIGISIYIIWATYMWRFTSLREDKR